MYGKSAKSLAQQGFPCIAPWPRRRRKGTMKTSKKWRKPLFRQPEKRAYARFCRSLGFLHGRLGKAVIHQGIQGHPCGQLSRALHHVL